MFLPKNTKFAEVWGSSTPFKAHGKDLKCVLDKTTMLYNQYIIHIINYEELPKYPSVEGNFV